MSDDNPEHCPEARLEPALRLAVDDTAKGADAVADLLADYPADPRLHFLHGSLLAALGDYVGGEAGVRRAVEIAPGYGLARFRLGFLRFTSGDAVGATEAWGPLLLESADHPLRLFVEGLQHLARDEFDPARQKLEAGMAGNTENAPLNDDLRLLLAELPSGPGADGEGEATSSVHWLLREAERRTRH